MASVLRLEFMASVLLVVVPELSTPPQGLDQAVANDFRASLTRDPAWHARPGFPVQLWIRNP
eukprot:4318550-Pyramimonas_sp.AAC.1